MYRTLIHKGLFEVGGTEFSKGDKVQLGDGSIGVVQSKEEREGLSGYKVRITDSKDESQIGNVVGASPAGMKKANIMDQSFIETLRKRSVQIGDTVSILGGLQGVIKKVASDLNGNKIYDILPLGGGMRLRRSESQIRRVSQMVGEEVILSAGTYGEVDGMGHTFAVATPGIIVEDMGEGTLIVEAEPGFEIIIDEEALRAVARRGTDLGQGVQSRSHGSGVSDGVTRIAQSENAPFHRSHRSRKAQSTDIDVGDILEHPSFSQEGSIVVKEINGDNIWVEIFMPDGTSQLQEMYMIELENKLQSGNLVKKSSFLGNTVLPIIEDAVEYAWTDGVEIQTKEQMLHAVEKYFPEEVAVLTYLKQADPGEFSFIMDEFVRKAQVEQGEIEVEPRPPVYRVDVEPPGSQKMLPLEEWFEEVDPTKGQPIPFKGKKALFMELPEILDMPQPFKDREIARLGMVAELDATSLYEKLADLADDQQLKEALLDVAKEEKTHTGEFHTILSRLDVQQVEENVAGAEEVTKLGQNDFQVGNRVTMQPVEGSLGPGTIIDMSVNGAIAYVRWESKPGNEVHPVQVSKLIKESRKAQKFQVDDKVTVDHPEGFSTFDLPPVVEGLVKEVLPGDPPEYDIYWMDGERTTEREDLLKKAQMWTQEESDNYAMLAIDMMGTKDINEIELKVSDAAEALGVNDEDLFTVIQDYLGAEHWTSHPGVKPPPGYEYTAKDVFPATYEEIPGIKEKYSRKAQTVDEATIIKAMDLLAPYARSEVTYRAQLPVVAAQLGLDPDTLHDAILSSDEFARRNREVEKEEMELLQEYLERRDGTYNKKATEVTSISDSVGVNEVPDMAGNDVKGSGEVMSIDAQLPVVAWQKEAQVDQSYVDEVVNKLIEGMDNPGPVPSNVVMNAMGTVSAGRGRPLDENEFWDTFDAIEAKMGEYAMTVQAKND